MQYQYQFKVYILCFTFIFLLVNSGCKKSDTFESELNLNNVKVYNDTTASIQNLSIQIASGANRIYFTYGIGKSAAFQLPGSYAKLNASDNEGELLWQSTLPTDVVINDLLALDGGGCIALGVNIMNGFIHLFHFDANGVNVKADSLMFQSFTVNSDGGLPLKIMRTLNGNLLIYGSGYLNLNGGIVGIAAELDMNFFELWERTYTGIYDLGSLSFNSCAFTPDGGYLFAGSDVDISFDFLIGNITLLKTNAAGDSLWTKTFIAKEIPYCNSMVPLSNGNYSLSFTTSTNSGINYAGIPETYIYQINAAGDSLNAVRIDKGIHRYNSAQVGLDNGSVFALMNSFNTSELFIGNTTWDQSNSLSVILNSTFTNNSGRFLQTKTNNYFADVCKTSDGRVACMGIIQSDGQSYYKPCILIYQ